MVEFFFIIVFYFFIIIIFYRRKCTILQFNIGLNRRNFYRNK